MDVYLILSILIMPLATWRLSNMLADIDQEGLFNSLAWIRHKVGIRFDEHSQPFAEAGSIGAGLLCVWCNSLWLGILFTLLLLCSTKLTFFVSLPFALSAGAIFTERIINGSKT